MNKSQGSTVKITKPKENISRALILDKILDEITDKQNLKAVGSFTYVRKKKSFLSRLFSR